jgi:DNA-binding NtrC family response regulator
MVSGINELEQSKSVKTIRILIVDDNPDDCFLIEDMILMYMNNDNVEISTANSFEQALEVCYDKEFDLCILDYRLGKRDGLRILHEFREHGFIMPIIFLTGQGDEEVAVRAMQSGASNYFSKRTLDPLLVVKAIRHAIKEHKTLMMDLDELLN